MNMHEHFSGVPRQTPPNAAELYRQGEIIKKAEEIIRGAKESGSLTEDGLAKVESIQTKIIEKARARMEEIEDGEKKETIQ